MCVHVWYIHVSVLGSGVKLEVNLQHMEFEEFMGQLSEVASPFSQRHKGLHIHIKITGMDDISQWGCILSSKRAKTAIGWNIHTYRRLRSSSHTQTSSWRLRPEIHLVMRTLLSGLGIDYLNRKWNHLLHWMFLIKLFYSFILLFIHGRIQFTNWKHENEVCVQLCR